MGCLYLKLTSIPQDFPSYVVTLTFDGNSVRRLGNGSTGFQKGLNQLVTLHMSRGDQPLNELGKNSFSTLTNLEVLVLVSNRMTSISGQAFSGLFNLRVLNLSNNLLRHLPTTTFKFCNIHDTLDLSNNLLEGKLNGGAFLGASVRQLILDNNRFTLLNTQSFRWLNSTLEVLHLQNNDASNMKIAGNRLWITDFTFKYLSSLKVLWLRNSSINGGGGSTGWISQLPSSLISLNVTNNPSKVITLNTHYPYNITTNIEYSTNITLGGWNFSRLPINVEELSISDMRSPFLELPDPTNSKLRILDISGNRMRTIRNIADYPMLEMLSLSNNIIKDLPMWPSNKLRRLNSIKLDG